MTSSERFVNITWKAPEFYDRFGHNVLTSSNYPRHGSSFFWGDYTVRYNALKTFNGLRTNCTFNIAVRRKLTFSSYEMICFMFVFLSNDRTRRALDYRRYVLKRFLCSFAHLILLILYVSRCVLIIAPALHRVIDILQTCS